MANKAGKAIDTTCLSLNQAEARGFLHRDYLAHCLRWSHVVAYLHHQKRYATHHLLDIGCGRELPLAKLLFSSRMTHTTGSYTGVDYGKLPWPDTITKDTDKFNLVLMEKADAAKLALKRKTYDTIVSFEMLEHVEPAHTLATLRRIRELMGPNTRAFISTPCYDQKMGAADNHVNEMSYVGLAALIQLAGLTVERSHGTFASQKDYKKLMTPAQAEVFSQLSAYYDSNVLSCIMAPMFPEQSRNCLWVLAPGRVKPLTTGELKGLSGPEHSSSTLWPKALAQGQKDALKVSR